jgi:hypothetical protein
MMKMKFLFRILGVAVTVAGCSQFDGLQSDGVNQKSGSLRVLITDAPFPIDLISEATVVIDRIELGYTDPDSLNSGDNSGSKNDKNSNNGKNDSDNKGNQGKNNGNGNSANGNKGDKDDSGNLGEEEDGAYQDINYITIFEGATEFNLLNLRNGITAVLAQNDTIPVGQYNRIRMHIKEAWVVLNDSLHTRFDLTIPGGSTGGLKIILENPLVISETSMTELLLDFDVSRSFIVQGNLHSKKGIKGFIFKPVIRASDLTSAGTISGFVKGKGFPLENAHLILLSGADTIVTALSGAQGNFTILGINPGEYSLVCEKDSFISQTKTGLIVKSNKTTHYNFNLSAN